MKLQYYICIALTAQISAASILQNARRALVRRQESEGASPSSGLSGLMSGLFGGTGTVSGVLSGYSIASTFVTAVNCEFSSKSKM